MDSGNGNESISITAAFTLGDIANLLTLFVTVATNERSFSKLKLIKKLCPKCHVSEERLSDLAMLSTEACEKAWHLIWCTFLRKKRHAKEQFNIFYFWDSSFYPK